MNGTQKFIATLLAIAAVLALGFGFMYMTSSNSQSTNNAQYSPCSWGDMTLQPGDTVPGNESLVCNRDGNVYNGSGEIVTFKNEPAVMQNDLAVAANDNNCPKNIAKGATVLIPAGCTVFGDVMFGKVVLHDVGGSDQATFVNIVGAGAYITAPYGAGVETTLSFSTYTQMVNHYVADEMKSGCGDSSPCSQVRGVIIENNNIVYDNIH